MSAKKIDQLFQPQGEWLAVWYMGDEWAEQPVVFWALQAGKLVGLVSAGASGSPGAHFECPENEPTFVGYSQPESLEAFVAEFEDLHEPDEEDLQDPDEEEEEVDG